MWGGSVGAGGGKCAVKSGGDYGKVWGGDGDCCDTWTRSGMLRIWAKDCWLLSCALRSRAYVCVVLRIHVHRC